MKDGIYPLVVAGARGWMVAGYTRLHSCSVVRLTQGRNVKMNIIRHGRPQAVKNAYQEVRRIISCAFSEQTTAWKCRIVRRVRILPTL